MFRGFLPKNSNCIPTKFVFGVSIFCLRSLVKTQKTLYEGIHHIYIWVWTGQAFWWFWCSFQNTTRRNILYRTSSTQHSMDQPLKSTRAAYPRPSGSMYLNSIWLWPESKAHEPLNRKPLWYRTLTETLRKSLWPRCGQPGWVASGQISMAAWKSIKRFLDKSIHRPNARTLANSVFLRLMYSTQTRTCARSDNSSPFMLQSIDFFGSEPSIVYAMYIYRGHLGRKIN